MLSILRGQVGSGIALSARALTLTRFATAIAARPLLAGTPRSFATSLPKYIPADTTAPAKTPAAKKPAAKASAAKKPTAAAKKPAAKKPVAKKSVAKKPVAKKAAAKKKAVKAKAKPGPKPKPKPKKDPNAHGMFLLTSSVLSTQFGALVVIPHGSGPPEKARHPMGLFMGPRMKDASLLTLPTEGKSSFLKELHQAWRTLPDAERQVCLPVTSIMRAG